MTTSIYEGFNLKSNDKSVILPHLKKIFNYDPNGLPNNFVVVYAEAKNFLALWNKYQSTAITATYGFPRVSSFLDISNQFPLWAEMKLGLIRHSRNGQRVNLYHLFVNMNQ